LTEPADGVRETVEYFVQCQQPDGVWEQASSMNADPHFAAERLSARRRMHPDFEFRIARRTTTVTVRAIPDCLDCGHWMCDGNGPCGALISVSAVSDHRCACTGPAASAS
jgi:hypothetical protein